MELSYRINLEREGWPTFVKIYTHVVKVFVGIFLTTCFRHLSDESSEILVNCTTSNQFTLQIV